MERKYSPMNDLVGTFLIATCGRLPNTLQAAAAIRGEGTANATATVSRGQTLATVATQQGYTPCIACHGKAVGMEPGIPGLVGLRSTYVVAQLTRWRVGDRHATEPDCMKRIATRLSEMDISAVAVWLSLQDPPKDSSPESSNLVRMPFACGSQR